MDKDRTKGKGKKIAGSIKEEVGKATGDKRLERAGKDDKAKGRVWSTLGSVKDKLLRRTK